MSANTGISRRRFVMTTAVVGGGMVVGFCLPGADVFAGQLSDNTIGSEPWLPPTDTAGTEINAWLVIAPDDTVTIRVAQSEMGEGIFTSLPMIVAEELECDWTKVRAEYASANRSLREGGVYRRMATNGSGAIRRSREYLQQAGASARERLIQAAANRWNVPAATCTAKDGVVTHAASGRTLRFGTLAAEAAAIRLSDEPAIKQPGQFTLLGTSVARLDTPVKVDGRATFGIDIRLPNMLFATSKTSPVVGGRVRSYDFDAIRDRPGVYSVVQFGDENDPVGLRSGVAVVADTFWRAKTALDLLPVEWDYGPHVNVNSTAVAEQDRRTLLEESGVEALNEGDALGSMANAGRLLEAVYSAPHQAHATMEPLNCTAQVTAQRVDVWLGTQNPERALTSAAEQSGVAPENVYVHNCFLGGGFGGRGNRSEVKQAVAIAKTLGGRPVNLVWTREEDFVNDYYNPSPTARFRAALGPDGMPVALLTCVASDSIMYWLQPQRRGERLDRTAVSGLANMPYAIPNRRVEYIMRNKHVPVAYWRAPGHNSNTFMLESFIDELAHAGGKDPVEFRRILLRNAPDWLRVLETVAQKGAWGKTLPPGTAQGVAICEAFGTIAAQIAEVSVSRRGEITVEKIVCALDCGNTINPRTIEMQVESCVAYGLSAALYGEVTLEAGAVVQRNFDSYPVVRMRDMPQVETHLTLSGGDKWGGIGEAGLPAAPAAVANAVFAITGKRMRSMPFRHHDLS